LKAVEIHRYGTAEEVLTINKNAPKPEVWWDQVLIRVKACSVNPIDCRMRAGYGRSVLPALRGFEFPLILGRDCAGVVEGVGSRVSRFKPGEKVFSAPSIFGQGTYAEYAAVDANEVVSMPGNLAFEEAAAMPFVATTTWGALAKTGGLRPENAAQKKVLVQAGSGGIGSFAIQLLKVWGCYVATTCSGRNVAWVKELGADEVIDYQKQDFSEHLHDFDVVLDPLGGETEEKSLAVLKKYGDARYVSLAPPLLRLLDEQGLLFGFSFYVAAMFSKKLLNSLLGRSHDWSYFEPDVKALEEVRRYLEEGRIRPVIDRVYPLEEVAEAHRHSESGHVRGKIVLRVE
jgi:NADPH:quinone reductase-like Zn-dependent oxidoreductase